MIAATSSGRGLAVPGEPARRFQRGNFGMHSTDGGVTVRSQPPKTHPERQMGDPGSGGAATPEQGKANLIPNVAFFGGVSPPLSSCKLHPGGNSGVFGEAVGDPGSWPS